jgi:hypothetical protein
VERWRGGFHGRDAIQVSYKSIIINIQIDLGAIPSLTDRRLARWLKIWRRNGTHSRRRASSVMINQGARQPEVEIFQADGVRNRIENHFQNKDSWDGGDYLVLEQ